VIDHLRRLLLVVPAVRASPGIALGELARQLACADDELRRDIALLACVGAPPFQPDDLIDIEVRDDRVWVVLPAGFERPTRLAATEAAALTAAARAMAPVDPTVHRAVEKLSNAVAPSQRELYEGLALRFSLPLAPVADDVRSLFERAALDRIELELQYRAPGEAAPVARRIRPRALAVVDGTTYLSAQRSDGQERLYRLDRVVRAELTGVHFEPLGPFDLAAALRRAARLEADAALPRARVRFSASVANAARPRHPGGDTTPAGEYDADVAYTSLGWLVSYVLSWGGRATVVAPDDARQALAAAVARAFAEHGTDATQAARADQEPNP
jgi:proteasome accessory factor C